MLQSKTNPSMSRVKKTVKKFARHVLLSFYPFRDEKELLLGFPLMHQNKLQEERVQDAVNINKINFEPYSD